MVSASKTPACTAGGSSLQPVPWFYLPASDWPASPIGCCCRACRPGLIIGGNGMEIIFAGFLIRCSTTAMASTGGAWGGG